MAISMSNTRIADLELESSTVRTLHPWINYHSFWHTAWTFRTGALTNIQLPMMSVEDTHGKHVMTLVFLEWHVAMTKYWAS
jgi:hypothetical protein